jgi:hypothetical protein
MATTLIGLVGAGIGSMFGLPGLGYTLGSALGGFVFGGDSSDLPAVEGPRLNDLRVQGSSYGSPIPIHFGRNRIAGQIIWAPPIVEHAATQEVGAEGGKGGPEPPSQTQTTYSYTASFALLLCRGPVAGVGRIWLDGHLFYDSRGTSAGSLFAGSSKSSAITFYTGSETQLPDPTMEAYLGYGNVPAYRGSAYIVFKDLQLEDYGNRIPNVTVEVYKTGSTQNGKSLGKTTGSYFWGDQTSSYVSVFTAFFDGLFRILNLKDNTVRLMDVQGGLVGYAKKDDTLDAYGNQLSYSCGRLNGYNLSYEGDAQFPFNGNHPQFGPGNLPQIYPYPYNNYNEDFRSTRRSNLFAVVENQSEYLVSFAVSADQRRAMIVTGSDNGVFGQGCPPSKWYLIYIQDEEPGIESSGSAVGFPVGTTTSLGVGNRTGLGGVIGTFTYSFHACTLENDYKHFWHVYGAGDKYVECFRVEPQGVTWVYHSITTPNGFAYPSIIAGYGMAWLTNRYNVETFTRLPIYASGEQHLAQVVLEIGLLSNLSSNDIDVSALSGTVKGYTIGRQTSIRSALQQLMVAYQFDAVESNGKIKFVHRGSSSIATITEDNLAAHPEGESLPDVITIRRQQELELPKRVNITYIDQNTDYQPGYQYAARIASSSIDEQTLELPIVMDSTQAARIADIVLYGLWQARQTYQFQVGIEYLYLEPCDVVTLQTPTATYYSRITSVEFGAPGLLAIQGVAEDAVYTSQAVGSSAQGFIEQTLAPAGPTDLRLLDIPIVRAIDNSPGFYMAASGFYEAWKGATIAQSSDNAAWNAVKTFVSPSIIGTANTVLGNGLTSIPDKANSINIKLIKGELSSITEEQLLNGGNLAVLGNEIIQFRDAILQSDGTYTLAYFLRGRFGTEWATTTHTQYEDFTLLTERTIQRVLLDENAINQKRYYKAVTLGATLDTATSRTFTYTGASLKPYAPVHLKGTRDSSNNLTISWIRRTRYGGEWRDNVDVPLGEVNESYEVNILNLSNVVIRTLQVNVPIVNYSAAQQTNDGLTPGSLIKIRIYQLSATVGRGFPAEATL